MVELTSYLPIVLVSCSLLSAAGSLFIIVIYLITPHLDALINRQIFFLAISGLLMSSGYLLTPWTYTLDPSSPVDPICIAQALLLSFSLKTSIFISFLTYYSVYLVIVDLYPRLAKQIQVQGFIDEVEDVKYALSRRIYILSAVSFALALIITPLPLLTGDYGPVAQGWCLLKQEKTYMDYTWMAIQFQGFFVVFICCSFYFHCRIRSTIKRVGEEHGNSGMYEEVKSKLIWYPIFVILCLLPVFANRVVENFLDYEVVVRCVVGAICSLNGFANMMVFGISGGFFESWCSHSEEDAASPLLTTS